MQEFHNNSILEHDLPDFENLELKPVSEKYLKVVIFNSAVFSLLLWIAGGVSYYFLRDVFMYSWLVFIVVFSLMIIRFITSYYAFFQRKYAFRQQDLVYHYGLLKKTTFIFPYSRIQHSALQEGWLSRSLGLKSLSVFTAGSEASDLTIHGLPKEIAEKFNQLILQKIQDPSSNGSFGTGDANPFSTETQLGETVAQSEEQDGK
ncbi:PH domain-containing protein [Chryseobacterium sp.]|uniref:PH domain-containing protein n=1 Tax=Chryseobacterium sp. TaxID=1871047 RepID=UPI0011C845F6|nr:PH domain-containing protein [Chryseobacterium sp.]TXF79419.1 PH domain-containing protein [Chryseobacterium sp.]